MSIIPDPSEARELRALFATHPLIGLAEDDLRAADANLHVRDAVTLLPTWMHYDQLAEREVRAVLARFVPAPAERCARCGRGVRYVTDGPDPGWWTHADLDELLDGTRAPHPAIPDYGDRDDSNSGPGWPFGGAR